MITERTLLDGLHRRYSSPRRAERYVVAEDVPVTPGGWRRRPADFIAQDCDLTGLSREGHRVQQVLVLNPDTGRHEPTVPVIARRFLHGHVIMTSRADWLRELADPTHAAAWRRYCDRWWLVTVAGVTTPAEIPEGWGLIVDGRVVVQAPVLDPEPMPRGARAALLRATVATARRQASASGAVP